MRCWLFHKWKNLWIGERKCERCGKLQFVRHVWESWKTATPKNPSPHGDFYERMMRDNNKESE